ncbi:MAG TPA: transglycosylase SLT domain-containing protein [Roseiflexaceae bacterium]|nr:transglycosylase SLT domain-containing protein [Roseiflexaceae bacterium]
MRRTPKRRLSLAALVLAVLLAACDMVAMPVPSEDSSGAAAGAPTLAAQAPTIVPTPMLPAPALLHRALRERENGDYDAVGLDLSALLEAYPNAAEARQARFYLAESYALRGRWTSAVESLRGLVDAGPQSPSPGAIDDLYARALFLTARGHEQAGAWADAVVAYEQYRALKTPLEPYARLRQAAQQQALGHDEDAAANYEAVATTDISRGERAGAYEKAIALRRKLGQNDLTLQLYHRLIEPTHSGERPLAELPEYRARMLSGAAALAAEIGAADQAAAWWRELAELAPASAEALDAVAQLDARQQPLEPTVAAQVYSAHEQWAAALPRYDSAIVAASGEDALDLRRRRALALRGNGDFENALAELAAVGAESPDSPAGRQAQLDWVQTKGQSGDSAGAITGYQEFAQAYPDDERAPEALSRVATLLARQGDTEATIQQQLDLGRRYPATDQAHDALFMAGWSLFHANRLEEARGAWDLLRQNTVGAASAQAAFWAARAAGSESPEYIGLLDAAIAAAPDSYYGARAAELLDKLPAGTAPVGAPISGASWRAAEDWIASWSSMPVFHLDESGYPPEIGQNGAVLRALALQDVALQPEAIAEWNQARAAWRDDPIKLYLLARLAHDHGVPYIALLAAEDLAERSPEHGFAKAPEALRRLIFPTPYADLIAAEANQRGLDPRALYAMLRQESRFNPGAQSGAGALGLAQVMPSTGEGIAQNLQIQGFQAADLLRPAVGVQFGAFYLDHQLDAMGGSLPGALAAYNGGPSNAQRWAGGASVADQDLFTEGIDYDETRNYVKLVYGYYGAYRRLYAAQ